MSILHTPQNEIYDHNVLYIKEYSDELCKLIHCKSVRKKGYEKLRDEDKRKESHININDERLENNISRAKQRIIEYALCNDFEYFFTGTLDPKKYNRFDYDKYLNDFSKFCNNYKNRRSVEFKYLIVPELHKDGAIHIHGFLGGLNQRDIIKNKYGHLEWISYSEKFGYMSFEPIRYHERSAYYCTKYITKDIEKIVGKNKQMFRCSKGLKRAKKERIDNVDPSSIEWDYENEYVRIATTKDKEEILSQITLLEGYA